MVARFVPAARAGVDARGGEAFGCRFIEQEMVDPNAGIALERLPPIGPEAVDALVGMPMPDRVGPALVEEPRVGCLCFRREQRVALPVLGLVDVEVGRDDIIVAAHDNGGFQVEQGLQMSVEPLHPFELIVELDAGLGVAVREVEAGDENAANGGFDIAALFVVRIAG